MDTLDTNEVTVETSLPITPDEPVSAFRFSAASSLSPARQEILGSWHRKFLRNATNSLTDLLRLELQLEVEAIEVQTYAQLIAEREDGIQGLIFRMQPQPSLWLLDVPVSLSVLLVERMMGGSGVLSTEKVPRELTDLEHVIFQQFAETLLSDYAAGWRPHAEIRPEMVRQIRTISHERALGHQADDLLLRVGIRVILKEGKSIMWIAIPIAAVEDLLLRSGAAEDRPREEEPSLIKDKNSPMGSVPVPVAIRWQGFQITLREVESMEPGDILILDNLKCESAVVWLANRAKFSGRVVRAAQKTTVTITEPLE